MPERWKSATKAAPQGPERGDAQRAKVPGLAFNQFCFCNLLVPVYRRFIAGYDSLALKEVKGLPDELWSVSPLCFAISNKLNNDGRQEGDCKEHYPQTHSKSNYPLSIHFRGLFVGHFKSFS